MSKDVIIAGAIAVGCIALIAVAFIAPKSKPSEPETPKTEITPLVTDSPGIPGLGTDPLNPGGLPPIGGPNTTGLPPLGGPNTTGLQPFGGQNTTGLPPVGGPVTGAPHSDPFGQAPLPMPVPVTVEAPAPVSESKTHTVANGELLGDIALKYYGSSKSWKKIQDANPGVDPKNLKVGQKLVIPGVAPKPSDTGAPVVAGPGEKTYTIKKGDSLYSIAQKELGSAAKWKEIQKLNGDISSSDLKVGQTLKLPSATTVVDSGTGAPAPTAGKTHTVAKGETLGDISAKYFKTSKNWKKIQDANPGVSPENLKVGQKLVIPDSESTGAGTTDTAAGTSTGEYVVKAGDTLSIIAQKELGSKNKWKEIQEANPGLDPRNLRTGQKLKIPGKAAAPAPVAPAPTPDFGNPNGFGAPNSGLGAPSNNFGAPNNGLGAPNNNGFGTPNLIDPAPVGSPTGSLNAPAPTPFGTANDPSFNSPYGNGGFGQPTQPFNQTGPGFSQTGAAPAPAPSQFGQPIPGESTLR